jgi:hypothetical protein
MLEMKDDLKSNVMNAYVPFRFPVKLLSCSSALKTWGAGSESFMTAQDIAKPVFESQYSCAVNNVVCNTFVLDQI